MSYYSKPKHLCQGTRDCENEKAKPHECPQEESTYGSELMWSGFLCTCCRECEQECLELAEPIDSSGD